MQLICAISYGPWSHTVRPDYVRLQDFRPMDSRGISPLLHVCERVHVWESSRLAIDLATALVPWSFYFLWKERQRPLI